MEIAYRAAAFSWCGCCQVFVVWHHGLPVRSVLRGCFGGWIQGAVDVCWPLSGFIPPLVYWWSFFCISDVSRAFQLNLLYMTVICD